VGGVTGFQDAGGVARTAPIGLRATLNCITKASDCGLGGVPPGKGFFAPLLLRVSVLPAWFRKSINTSNRSAGPIMILGLTSDGPGKNPPSVPMIENTGGCGGSKERSTPESYIRSGT
jgi:hypothetical protein